MSGRIDKWTTEIAEVREDEVLIRGYRLSDLVGQVSFTDMILLVHTGDVAPQSHRAMLDAILVSLIEHGISPSTIIARTLASCGTPSQAAIAGGALSIADWHGGSGEQLGEVLAGIVDSLPGGTATEREAQLRAEAASLVAEYRRRGQRFEGFGHPQHPHGDPRALRLLDLAEELAVAGDHVRLLRSLSEEIQTAMGRPLPPNVTGAIAAVLLDLGFSWRAIRGIVIAARTAGLVAHVVEELEQGGRWRHAPAESVEYVGPTERDLSQRPDDHG